MVKCFLDVGFLFKKWCGTNGHVFDREIPPFDDICRRYVANGGVMDEEEDVKLLKEVAEKSLKKVGGNGKGKKRKGGINVEMEEAGAVEGKKEEDVIIAATMVESEKESLGGGSPKEQSASQGMEIERELDKNDSTTSKMEEILEQQPQWIMNDYYGDTIPLQRYSPNNVRVNKQVGKGFSCSIIK